MTRRPLPLSQRLPLEVRQVQKTQAERVSMVQLPAVLRTLYRVATTHDVRSWSFGGLTKMRVPAASWSETGGTLNDQRIFGPLELFACACRKFQGARYERMICDRCGVKITSPNTRRSRFGHVDLTTSIPHPLGLAGETIQVFPIVPAAFFESSNGQPLANLYDQLIESNASNKGDEIAAVIDQITKLLVPTFIDTFNWNLPDADIFARGIALTRVSEANADDERCDACGYPLRGLIAENCPGCGKNIRRD